MADRPRDHVVVALEVGLVWVLLVGARKRGREVAADRWLLCDDECLSHVPVNQNTTVGQRASTAQGPRFSMRAGLPSLFEGPTGPEDPPRGQLQDGARGVV